MKSFKIIFWILLGLVVFTVFSCRKNSKYYQSYAKFIVNDKISWVSSRAIIPKEDYYKNNPDSILTFGFGKGFLLYSGKNTKKYPKEKDIFSYKENFDFTYIRKRLGKQYFPKMSSKILSDIATKKLPIPPLVNLTTNLEEIPVEDFFVDSNHLDQCWIEITKQEHDFKKIWGNFNLVMTKEANDKVYIYPENITIKSGEFYVEF